MHAFLSIFLPPPSDQTESVVRALQSASAAVYDRNGMRCNVAAIPPPSPNCVADLICPTRNTPPADCDIVRVRCPDFTCPSMPPPPTEPLVPDAYKDTRPPIPSNPIRECGWPVINLFGGIFSSLSQFLPTDVFLDAADNAAFGVRTSVVKQRTGLGPLEFRLPVLRDDAPIGCFPPSIAGPPEPLPDDVAAAGIPVGTYNGFRPEEKDFAKRHPAVAKVSTSTPCSQNGRLRSVGGTRRSAISTALRTRFNMPSGMRLWPGAMGPNSPKKLLISTRTFQTTHHVKRIWICTITISADRSGPRRLNGWAIYSLPMPFTARASYKRDVFGPQAPAAPPAHNDRPDHRRAMYLGWDPPFTRC